MGAFEADSSIRIDCAFIQMCHRRGVCKILCLGHLRRDDRLPIEAIPLCRVRGLELAPFALRMRVQH